MKNLKSIILSVALGATALTTGCATVTGGTTQEVSLKTQKPAADTPSKDVDVVGANCVLTNSKGTWEVVTPGKVKVHRAKDDLNVACTKDGESPASTTFKSSFRKGAFAGNLIMFGVVGTLAAQSIDSASGASYDYPDDMAVSFGLGKDGPLGVPANASTQIPAVTAPATDSTQSNQPVTTGSVGTGVQQTQAAANNTAVAVVK